MRTQLIGFKHEEKDLFMLDRPDWTPYIIILIYGKECKLKELGQSIPQNGNFTESFLQSMQLNYKVV